jgi:hypothetical protein
MVAVAQVPNFGAQLHRRAKASIEFPSLPKQWPQAGRSPEKVGLYWGDPIKHRGTLAAIGKGEAKNQPIAGGAASRPQIRPKADIDLNPERSRLDAPLCCC